MLRNILVDYINLSTSLRANFQDFFLNHLYTDDHAAEFLTYFKS